VPGHNNMYIAFGFQVILLIEVFLSWCFHRGQHVVAGEVLLQGFLNLANTGPLHRWPFFASSARTPVPSNRRMTRSRIFSHFQMLRYCRLGHLEGCRQFIDGGLTFGEAREDRAARRVGQGCKGASRGCLSFIGYSLYK